MKTRYLAVAVLLSLVLPHSSLAGYTFYGAFFLGQSFG